MRKSDDVVQRVVEHDGRSLLPRFHGTAAESVQAAVLDAEPNLQRRVGNPFSSNCESRRGIVVALIN
jgi:hypothetical protein